MQRVPPSDTRRDAASAMFPSHDVPRAGLRTPPSAGTPTGKFVVVEMTILVIVVALAMVSVIVASAEDGGRDSGGRDTVGFDLRARAALARGLHADVASGAADVRRAGEAK